MLYKLKRIRFDINKVIAILFILLIFIFSVGTGLKVVKTIITSMAIRLEPALKMQAMDNNTDIKSKSVMTDKEATKKPNSKAFSGLFGLVNKVISSMNSRYDNNILLRSKFIDLNGGIQLLMNKKIVEDVEERNTVYKMNNGQLTFLYPKYDTDYCVKNISELNDYLTKRGIKMLYIQAPFKINKFDNQLPVGLQDYTNLNADKFLHGIKKHKVPYLDLRELIKFNNMQYDNLFYNTDHHWKTETAFWAYKTIMEFLNENYGVDYNKKTTDINSFTVAKYKDSFLGSQGRRVGKYYGGIDDYVLLCPDFATNYDIEILSHFGYINKKTGSFEDAIVESDFIDANSPVITNKYAAYFGGDFPLLKITNKNVSNGRVLILQDSFGLPFSAFMSLNFNQVDIMDLRYFREQTFFEYIDERKYDMVFFLYNPSVFSVKEDEFQFIFK